MAFKSKHDLKLEMDTGSVHTLLCKGPSLASPPCFAGLTFILTCIFLLSADKILFMKNIILFIFLTFVIEFCLLKKTLVNLTFLVWKGEKSFWCEVTFNENSQE